MAVPFQELLQLCLDAALGAGAIIRSIQRSGVVVTDKDGKALDNVGDVDPTSVVTQADRQAQYFVVSKLRAVFPQIRIVGEEDVTEPPVASNTKIPPAPRVPEFTLEAEWEDLVVWVDPLDGTKEFVCGNVDNVTVLIGITLRSRPVAGIIYGPFTDDVCWGAQNLGVFLGTERIQPTLVSKSSRAPWLRCFGCDPVQLNKSLVISASKKNGLAETVDALIEQDVVHEVAHIGGFGNKMLSVILGKHDAAVQLPGTSRWDCCAGEALLKILGGHLWDMKGKQYLYDENGDVINSTGICASRDEELLRRVCAVTQNIPLP